jgi:hypothetical protein
LQWAARPSGTAPARPAAPQLRCHDPSGDDCCVTFTWKTVRISSCQDDALRDAVETRADAVATLD